MTLEDSCDILLQYILKKDGNFSLYEDINHLQKLGLSEREAHQAFHHLNNCEYLKKRPNLEIYDFSLPGYAFAKAGGYKGERDFQSRLNALANAATPKQNKTKRIHKRSLSVLEIVGIISGIIATLIAIYEFMIK